MAVLRKCRGKKKVERENSLAKSTSGKSQDTTEEGESSGYIKKGDFRRMKRQREEEEAAYELSAAMLAEAEASTSSSSSSSSASSSSSLSSSSSTTSTQALKKARQGKQPSLSQNGNDPFSFKHPVFQGQWSDISEFYGISKEFPLERVFTRSSTAKTLSTLRNHFLQMEWIFRKVEN